MCSRGVVKQNNFSFLLAQNAGGVSLKPALGIIFPIFITHTHDTGAVTRMLSKFCIVWSLTVPCICMCYCMCIAYMYYVFVGINTTDRNKSFKRLNI